MKSYGQSLVSVLLVLSFPLTSYAFQQPATGVPDMKKPPAAGRPNIIFILTDDQRWDALGAMGNTIIATPHMNQLASAGILFRNAYVTTSICCVSRASILTGQYESKHHIHDFRTDLSASAVSRSYPALLKKAGYTMGFIGKFGVGTHPPRELFDFWVNTEAGGRMQPDYVTTDNYGHRVHDTDTLGHAIQHFLDRYSGRQPFCLSVSFKAPHEQDGDPPTYVIQPGYGQYYKDVTIPEPVTAAGKYWTRFPKFFQTDSNFARQRWKGLFGTPALYQENVKNYYRLITGVDDVVGNMMNKLDSLGISNNTIIIIMGDNGMLLGEHGMEGKWYGYEESIRVPLIIYDPLAPEKIRQYNAPQIALNIDIAPTILAMAGIPAPTSMQGIDLIGLAEDKVPERKDFFYQYYFLGGPQLPREEGVVTRDYKYMKYIEHGYEELFDIRHDPHETDNLAADPAYKKELARLRARYRQLQAAYGVPRSVWMTKKKIGNGVPRRAGQPGVLRPADLTCEGYRHPMGMDDVHGALSWVLQATGNQRGQCQQAYRIQVASSKALLLSGTPDLWDSKVVASSQCNNIPFGGATLPSGARCYWRVMVWDGQHLASRWSDISCWDTGLLTREDWKAAWIESSDPYPASDTGLYHLHPAPLFRKEFHAGKPVRRAVMYVSGIGYYEAYLNGKRVGNRLLDPGWTDYSKRVLYSTYDVTSLLSTGNNCLGVLLGNGWYNPLPLRMWGRIDIREALPVGEPKFILQLNVQYADGSRDVIVSDESWRANSSAILRNSIYLGEEYDARKEIPGWNRTGVSSAQWRNVRLAEAPGGVLQAEPQPPVAAIDTISPVAIRRRQGGRYVIDFGRNFGGIIKIKAAGKAGTVISLRYGEVLYADGSLNVMTAAAGQIKRKGVGGPGAPDTAYATDVFILDGKGTDVFQPRFTFHGFRYVEVTGYPGPLRKEDITGLALCSDVPAAGRFSCSGSLLDRIQWACLNTFRSNLFSVQSDCPDRERFGYGGDIVATCEAFMDNFDMSAFYRKTVQDFADEAQPDGGLTETAPYVGIASDGLAGRSGPVEWGTVLPVLLYRLYQYYGNIDLLRRYYPLAKGWVDFLHRHAKDQMIDQTIGDHESIDQQLTGMSATAFYYYNTALLVKFAGLLDKKEDVARYTLLQDSVRTAFAGKFLDTSNGYVGIHTAAAQAYALYFNLVPSTSADDVLRVMTDAIAANGYHIASGIFGTAFIMDVLGRSGLGKIARTLATQTTFPGWGFMMASGATTLWEHWAGSENTYSHNHPMFGSISNWLYSYIAGIRPADDARGYDHIIIQPETSGLTWASATYHSVLGRISSHWTKTGSSFTLDVAIPVNATALVFIPAPPRDIREGGMPLTGRGDMSVTGARGAGSTVKIGSGSYHFTATLVEDNHLLQHTK